MWCPGHPLIFLIMRHNTKGSVSMRARKKKAAKKASGPRKISNPKLICRACDIFEDCNTTFHTIFDLEGVDFSKKVWLIPVRENSGPSYHCYFEAMVYPKMGKIEIFSTFNMPHEMESPFLYIDMDNPHKEPGDYVLPNVIQYASQYDYEGMSGDEFKIDSN